MSEMQLEAESLRTCWIVRPVGRCGTCGFYPAAWDAQFVTFHRAKSAEDAVRYARAKLRGMGR